MEIAFRSPERPLAWPPLIARLAQITESPARLYLVGGPVRDALRQRPIHDIDLATPDDGLSVARRLADQLKGAYYPIDVERRTGRIILKEDGVQTVIDIASLRGTSLLEDLERRDFTVNAMAVQLDRLGDIIDPLGGQHDLFDEKVLRQCNPQSISADPIRALRAARQSLQLGLKMDTSTRNAARAAAAALVDASGELAQPERVRDELFKLLGLPRPASALRLLHALGLLACLSPTPLPDDHRMERNLATVEALSSLLAIISPTRDDNTAADLVLGMAVMVLDRYRHSLQEHFARTFADGRSRAAIALLGAMAPLHDGPWQVWGSRLRLSNLESQVLTGMQQAARFDLLAIPALTDRLIYRYYRRIAESGVDGLFLVLAGYLAGQRPSPDPREWARLLEAVAAPMLEAFFRRHHEVIAPPPLLSGNDLQQELGLEPGPKIGQITERLREEQAAGEIRNRQEALRFARGLVA